MAVHKKFNALGRGLDALLSTESVRTEGSSTISEIPLEQIERNPNQPRSLFDEDKLEELAASIREIGIIQPITLRQIAENRFQIIAGERRWRASQIAGLKTIPAYIRTIKDESVMEMALVENIQREDLNPIEISLAYEHLMEGKDMTQEKVAERVGKSRANVTNYLRLLKLPAQVQMALQKKEIDMGHARTARHRQSFDTTAALQGNREEWVVREKGRGDGAASQERRGHRCRKEKDKSKEHAV